MQSQNLTGKSAVFNNRFELDESLKFNSIYPQLEVINNEFFLKIVRRFFNNFINEFKSKYPKDYNNLFPETYREQQAWFFRPLEELIAPYDFYEYYKEFKIRNPQDQQGPISFFYSLLGVLLRKLHERHSNLSDGPSKLIHDFEELNHLVEKLNELFNREIQAQIEEFAKLRLKTTDDLKADIKKSLQHYFVMILNATNHYKTNIHIETELCAKKIKDKTNDEKIKSNIAEIVKLTLAFNNFLNQLIKESVNPSIVIDQVYSDFESAHQEREKIALHINSKIHDYNTRMEKLYLLKEDIRKEMIEMETINLEVIDFSTNKNCQVAIQKNISTLEDKIEINTDSKRAVRSITKKKFISKEINELQTIKNQIHSDTSKFQKIKLDPRGLPTSFFYDKTKAGNQVTVLHNLTVDTIELDSVAGYLDEVESVSELIRERRSYINEKYRSDLIIADMRSELQLDLSFDAEVHQTERQKRVADYQNRIEQYQQIADAYPKLLEMRKAYDENCEALKKNCQELSPVNGYTSINSICNISTAAELEKEINEIERYIKSVNDQNQKYEKLIKDHAAFFASYNNDKDKIEAKAKSINDACVALGITGLPIFALQGLCTTQDEVEKSIDKLNEHIAQANQRLDELNKKYIKKLIHDYVFTKYRTQFCDNTSLGIHQELRLLFTKELEKELIANAFEKKIVFPLKNNEELNSLKVQGIENQLLRSYKNLSIQYQACLDYENNAYRECINKRKAANQSYDDCKKCLFIDGKTFFSSNDIPHAEAHIPIKEHEVELKHKVAVVEHCKSLITGEGPAAKRVASVVRFAMEKSVQTVAKTHRADAGNILIHLLTLGISLILSKAGLWQPKSAQFLKNIQPPNPETESTTETCFPSAATRSP